MRWAILAAVLIVPTGAMAQVTTCGPEFNKWVCRTQPAPLAPVYFGAREVEAGQEAGQRAYEQTSRVIDDYQAARQAAQDRQRSRTSDNLVLYDHLMATGQCDAARNLAERELGRNEIDAVADHCH